MQYNIKITTMRGKATEGTPSRMMGASMVNHIVNEEMTVGQIKEVAKKTYNIKDYTNDEIVSAVLLVKGEEAKDDNVKVPERTFINYVLTIK